MELQVGVKALLQNNEGKYLLLRRSSEKYPEAAQQWDIVGGRIDAGTNLIENLRREVLEETGLELRGEPKLVAAQDILRPPERHIVRLTYIGNADGNPKLSGEHTEYKWFAREELEQLENLDGYFKELIDRK